MTSDKSDQVNHPAHYGGADNPYEAIKVIEAWKLGFRLGSTVKYIARAGKKGERMEDRINDLEKAEWYLKREIEQLKIQHVEAERLKAERLVGLIEVRKDIEP